MSKLDALPKSPPKTGLDKRRDDRHYKDERFKTMPTDLVRALSEFKKSPVFELLIVYFRQCEKIYKNELMDHYLQRNYKDPVNGEDGAMTMLGAKYAGSILGMREMELYVKAAEDELQFRLRKQQRHGELAYKALSGEPPR